jgi:carbon-monoxide dehydrogenase medium subunit
MRSAMETELAHDEVVTGIRVPKFSSRAGFGYHKICRKTGEFAEAIGVAVHDPDRDVVRLVASTTAGRPIVLEDRTFRADSSALRNRLTEAGLGADTYEMNVRVAALQRAMREARPE